MLVDSDEGKQQQNANRVAEYERAYESRKKREQVRTRVSMLRQALRRFYKISERLPVTVEELECRIEYMARVPCANELTDGTSYIDGADQWAAVTPSVAARELRIADTYGPDRRFRLNSAPTDLRTGINGIGDKRE